MEQPPNLAPTTKSLKQLLQEFDSGDLQLPAFQRPFVWNVRQTLNLLDSLLRGYPISVVYLWKPGPDSQLKSKKKTFSKRGSPQVNQFEAYIIDGQQRLTSLHAAFGLSEAFDSATGRSLECWLELDGDDERDGRLTKLFQSPANKAFLEDAASQNVRRVRLKDILQTPHQILRDQQREFLQDEKMASTPIERALSRIDAAYRMLSTPITCIMITESADEEVLQVFKRLNRGGTGLRERDVKAADLGIGKSVEVLQEMQAFVGGRLPRALGFGFSFAFRALVVFHKGTAQFNSLRRSWADTDGDRGQSLEESWEETVRGLSAAMTFVDRIGWSRKPLLPSCNALIPLAYALERLNRDPTRPERASLVRWLCLAALRSVFVGSVETTINRHLRKIADEKRNPLNGLLEALTINEKRPIRPEEFEQITSLWGPFSQVMYAWLVDQNAKDWISGHSLDRVARMALESRQPEETLSIQHIFPRKLLADQGCERDAANRPSNFAIIAETSNSSFNALLPSEAIQRLDSHDKRERASLQMFSKDAGEVLRSGRYEDFCEWRAKRLAEAWNRWLDLN